jgi:hypothetical protein
MTGLRNYQATTSFVKNSLRQTLTPLYFKAQMEFAPIFYAFHQIWYVSMGK